MFSTFVKASAISVLTVAVLSGCTTTNQITQIGAPTAKTIKVHAVSTTGVGQEIGVIHLADSVGGLVLSTKLHGLPAGERGFHIHENGSCAPANKDGRAVAALAAGGHFNPQATASHGTPLTGHLGDLPALKVEMDGTSNVKVVAPRLKLADVTGRSIMIHAGGDNYSDSPQPLGGGGERIACGLI